MVSTHNNKPSQPTVLSTDQYCTRGDAGASRRAGPGDAEQEPRERGLLLGHTAGLREEAHEDGSALLHRQVPGAIVQVNNRGWMEMQDGGKEVLGGTRSIADQFQMPSLKGSNQRGGAVDGARMETL